MPDTRISKTSQNVKMFFISLLLLLLVGVDIMVFGKTIQAVHYSVISLYINAQLEIKE